MVKKKGIWYLTKEGEEAMKIGEIGLLEAATEAYRKWKKEKESAEAETEDLEDISSDKEQEATIDEIEQLAVEGLKRFIKSKNPYEF